MLAVALGFAAGGLLLFVLGLLIRRGMTWLIAGYDPRLVADERGLARWFGSRLMPLGGAGLLAGAAVAVVPEDYIVVPILLNSVAILGGVITLVIGAQRFTRDP